jgi:hypothetical protein
MKKLLLAVLVVCVMGCAAKKYITIDQQGEGMITVQNNDTLILGENKGVITWKNGDVEVYGELSESAEIFFEYFVKPMIEEALEDK